ncbi:MAG: hypothetical protein QOJ57_402 [Thermoleophilaceae bacterium]|nr:hypothetical protein [Thermoleophilaceae bacterium]
MEQGGGAGETSGAGGPGRFDSFEERFELIIAILLGLAAVVGAIAAYQTGIKDGDTLQAFQQGNRTADKASRLKAEVATKRAEDQIVATFALQGVVSANLTAAGAGTELSEKDSQELSNTLINTVGSPELKAANKKCNADDACSVQIDSKYYVVPEAAQAAAADKEADKLFATANKADKEGDDYSLVTIFLATSLFLYGVAAVGRGRSVKLGMAGLGAVIFVIAVGLLVTI